MATLPPVATVGAPGTTLASAETAIFPPPVEVIEVPGTPSADVLIGTGKPEHMQGFRGDDVLYGGAGDDSLDGGIGTDRLEGGPGNDSYDGGPGRDLLSFALEQAPALVDLQNSQVTVSGTFEFTQNVEDLTGSAFGDTLMGDAEDNVLVGGGGLDLLAGRLGNDTLDGGADGAYASWSDLGGPVAADLAAGIATEWDGGTDTLSGIVGAVGTRFDDTLAGDDEANRLEGGAGTDRLDGRGGDDVLAGGSGADTLDGGGGIDTADYSGGGPTRVDLVSGDALDESGAVDTLTGIENLVGSLGDDLLVGDDGANRLQGGVGADTLRGNGGADVFAYADRLEFGDTIRDFTSGSDVIELARAAVGAGTVAFDAGVLNLLDGDTTTLIAVIAGDTVAAADIQIV